jgi:hypothetical protein
MQPQSRLEQQRRLGTALGFVNVFYNVSGDGCHVVDGFAVLQHRQPITGCGNHWQQHLAGELGRCPNQEVIVDAVVPFDFPHEVDGEFMAMSLGPIRQILAKSPLEQLEKSL